MVGVQSAEQLYILFGHTYQQIGPSPMKLLKHLEYQSPASYSRLESHTNGVPAPLPYEYFLT